MGILTLLRNAFGRSRKGRGAEAEGADLTPSQSPEPTVPSPSSEPQPTASAQVPEPRSSNTESEEDQHDLVSAAFDNVSVPRPSEPVDPVTQEPAKTPAAKTDPKPEATEEPKPAAAPEEPAAPTAPEAESEPESEPAPAPEAESEPVTETESETVTEPEPEPVVEPEPVAEAEVEPEPAVEPKVQPEPVAEVTPEPAAATEVTPEPVAAAADEPAAADGEDAPQGPPAADDESSTGGAGGNDSAEGEGEAEAEAEPVPATLRTAYTAAETTLKATNLTGTTAKVYLVLDRSASMRPYYKDGSAQALGEQTLALAAHLDPEGPGDPGGPGGLAAKVHVVFFSTEVDGTGELTLTDHDNKIDDLHAGLGRMGRTSYHVAVEEVLAHHGKESPGTPALVVFQTDGAPDAKTPATQSLTDAAKNHPSVFFSFVAFGDPENKAFDYLRKLKLDNTSLFLAGETPRELTDAEVYEGILASWRP